jgi:hypothetical protein
VGRISGDGEIDVHELSYGLSRGLYLGGLACAMGIASNRHHYCLAWEPFAAWTIQD